MDINVIQEIQRAEEQATLILDKSRDDSKKILNDALIRANNEYNTIIDLANIEYKKILQDYENQGKNAVTNLDSKHHTFEVSSISNDNRELAINKIMQEIINLWQ